MGILGIALVRPDGSAVNSIFVTSNGYMPGLQMEMFIIQQIMVQPWMPLTANQMVQQ